MTAANPDRWAAPNYASFTGSDATPLQQTFQSLSTYLEKINNSVTIASAAGVSSAVAGTGISVSGATGAVTFANTGVTSAIAGTGIGVSAATGGVTFTNSGVTSLVAGTNITLSGSTGAVTINAAASGVTSLAGTTNQITVSGATGAVTLSLPSSVTISGKYTSTGNSQITMGQWTADVQWGGIEGANGYLLMGRSSGDSSIYLRTSNGSSNVYIGANGNNTLTVGTSSATVTGNFTAGGVVTGQGGIVANVFTTGVAYGSYGAVSLIGAGNNTYTGIANAHYSCAVMWHNTIFGHYRNNSTWNFYFETGNLYCTSVNLAGGINAVGNIDIQNRYRGTAPNSGAYIQMRSGNATSFNWNGSYQFVVDSTHVKTFTIQHPTKPDNLLVHACTEGPTADVFYRGKAQLKSGICVVTLPDYFEELAELEGRSVMLTPIADQHGMVANLAAYEIEDGRFLVEQIGGYHVPDQRFWWRVDAVRKNTTFNVEPEKSSVTVRGDGPYTYVESNT